MQSSANHTEMKLSDDIKGKQDSRIKIQKYKYKKKKGGEMKREGIEGETVRI